MHERDTLSRMLDVVGLDVRMVEHIEAEPDSSWVRCIPRDPGWVWVTSRWAEVWLRVGGEWEPLAPCEVMLVRTDADVEIASQRDAVDGPTSPEAIGGVSVGWSGVLWGTASFGELAEEVIGMPAVRAVRQSSEVRERVAAFVDQLVIEWPSSSAGSAAVSDALARMVVVAVLRAEPPAAFGDGLMLRALRVIHAEPIRPERCTIEALSEVTGLAERTFRRRFHEATGRDAGAYLRWWRIVVARRLLADGTSDLAEIAAVCGYESRPAFSAAFRAETKESPSGYRRTHRLRQVPVPFVGHFEYAEAVEYEPHGSRMPYERTWSSDRPPYEDPDSYSYSYSFSDRYPNREPYPERSRSSDRSEPYPPDPEPYPDLERSRNSGRSEPYPPDPEPYPDLERYRSSDRSEPYPPDPEPYPDPERSRNSGRSEPDPEPEPDSDSDSDLERWLGWTGTDLSLTSPRRVFPF